MTAALLATAGPTRAADLHALVIGIDRYATLRPLKGAVNDARDVAQTLESLQPKTLKLLLDEQASREAILTAWDEIAASAKPGDTIFMSYAGHGVQIDAAVAGQEEDGLDEVWALSGFSDSGPGSAQRIIDDEWGARIAEVDPGVKVVLLLDACHSGTLTRSAYPGAPGQNSRFGGRFAKIRDDALPPPPPRPDDRTGARPNEVYIGGVADDRSVPEVEIGQQARGALSYYFSRGLRGLADADHNGEVTLAELQSYLIHNVRQRTESQQTPVIRSGGPATLGLFKVSTLSPYAVPLRPVRLAIRGGGAESPRLLAQLTTVESTSLSAADLVWEWPGGRILSQSGDWVATAHSSAEMQGEIDKFLALLSIRQLAETDSFAARLPGGDGRYRFGDSVSFAFGPRREPYLTVINLAATGIVELLYPINPREEQALNPAKTFSFPPTQAQPPAGANHVIAIASRDKPDALRARLETLHGRRGASEAAVAIEQAFASGTHQLALIGMFTGEDP